MANSDAMLRLSIVNPAGVNLPKIQHSFQQLGFRVEPDGKRGFLLFGSVEVIESVFDSKVLMKDNSLYFSTDPKEEKVLKEIEFRAYFPRKPDFF